MQHLTLEGKSIDRAININYHKAIEIIQSIRIPNRNQAFKLHESLTRERETEGETRLDISGIVLEASKYPKPKSITHRKSRSYLDP